ncbi:MAG: Wzz/FepE/Etk N-terminal domain-containing protein [Bacteroidota bacterium]
MEEFSNNISILNIIIKRYKIIVGLVILSILLSVVFSSSYFIKPKYKSIAVVYPANIIPYSQETPTEQLLQLFNSEDVMQKIITKFNLGAHYNIDSNDIYYHSKLSKEVSENIKISKTEFESVEINVMDTDPKTACNIVFALIDFVNQKAKDLQNEKALEVVKIWESQLVINRNQVDSIKTALNAIRTETNVIDYDAQVKEASRQFFTMAKSQNPSNNNYLTKFMSKLRDKGGDVYWLTQRFNVAVSEYNRIKVEYDNALMHYNKDLTFTNVVTNPSVADKKSYPIRWLIVVFSVFSTILLSIIIVLTVDRFKNQ